MGSCGPGFSPPCTLSRGRPVRSRWASEIKGPFQNLEPNPEGSEGGQWGPLAAQGPKCKFWVTQLTPARGHSKGTQRGRGQKVPDQGWGGTPLVRNSPPPPQSPGEQPGGLLSWRALRVPCSNDFTTVP